VPFSQWLRGALPPSDLFFLTFPQAHDALRHNVAWLLIGFRFKEEAGKMAGKFSAIKNGPQGAVFWQVS